MRFAVNVPTSVGASEYSTLPFCEDVEWPVQRAFAERIENLGFDGIGVPDHLMTGDGATTECLSTVTGLAAVTESIELFPKTINNELRHGPLLAKTTATIDQISDGRLKLGMGAGWKANEAKAYGYDWPDAPDRLRAMEETIELTTRLWTEDKVTYDGVYYQTESATCKPHPVQEPRPPIMIGGGGEEFTLRIAAQYADEWNYWGPPEVMEHKLAVLANHCETYDTDFESIDISWFARCFIGETDDDVQDFLEKAPRFQDPDADDPLNEYNNLIGTPEEICAELEQYGSLGVDEVVVEFVDFPSGDSPELFASEVMPAFI